MVDEFTSFMLINPLMIDGVPLSQHMDKYYAYAYDILEDRCLELDCERLHFDIDEDDLLDDSKGVFKIDTRSSS